MIPAVVHNVNMFVCVPAETYTIDFVNSTGVHAIVSIISLVLCACHVLHIELPTLSCPPTLEWKLTSLCIRLWLCTLAMSACDRHWLHY